MSLEADIQKLSVEELAHKLRGDLVPINHRFSYFFAALPSSEEDVQEYLREPVAALPSSLLGDLPSISVLLVPYLERVTHTRGGREMVEDFVVFEEPSQQRRIWSSKLAGEDGVVLVFGLRDQDVADYHYSFYHLLADVAIDVCGANRRDEFNSILRDELSSGVHGEVDEQSWQLKQELIQKQRNVRRKSKGFDAYARQSLLDTLTLYLHGICCDIDVETGPRQIASRHLRRRLELLQDLYSPPEGYAVFPEELNHVNEKEARKDES